MSAHPDDPAVCGDGIKRATQTAVATFAHVGPREDTWALQQALEWHATVPWAALGPVSLATLPAVLAEFDAGIVPLADNRFNQSKSWLKAMEYAACGVPAVASPTPEYREFQALGGCVLAASPADWFGEVTRLLGNPTYRAERAEAGLEVAQRWTYETHAHEWAQIWDT
jgi:glycosyltransferase involved in cell wall biosynthesis